MLALDTIHPYTAWRLGCALNAVTEPGTTVIAATPPPDKNLLRTTVLRRPDHISVTTVGNAAIVRVNAEPAAAVQHAIAQLSTTRAVSREDLLKLTGLTVEADEAGAEPYYYLDPAQFQPHHTSHADYIRQLTTDDSALMDGLYAGIDEGMRWFVELDHPVVFGYVLDGELVAAASHFLFADHQIAATGVVVHRDFRRRGLALAISSAAAAWAIERGWMVEWSTWLGNLASMALAARLGFVQYALEQEFVIRFKEPR